jgi:hypothetical protein
MSDAEFLARVRADLARPTGYVRHGTLFAVCLRAAESADRAFAVARGGNRERLVVATRAAAGELTKLAEHLEEGGGT